MIDSTTAPPSTDPAGIRAERRRLVESVAAHRRLLAGRRPFELADLRRLNREAGARARAEARRGKALQRIHEKRTRRERSLAGRLDGLDGKRATRERRALAVLRRESIERSLRGTRLTASQVNGIGSGLVRDLAALGITSAADFRRVSWGKAPNGRGGEVLYIHRTEGGKVHVNGIGEHRGRPLMEWRRAAVARAEARAPRELPADERHRIEEIVENERVRLREELAQVPQTAEAARAEARELHAERLAALTDAEREARADADLRRAAFDETAERLLAVRAELAAHVDAHGDLGLMERRTRSRALRPLPAGPAAIPPPRSPGARPKAPEDAHGVDGRRGAEGLHGGEHATGAVGAHDGESAHRADRAHGARRVGDPSAPGLPVPAPEPEPVRVHADGDGAPAASPGIRAGLGWLAPVALFGATAVLGAGETDATPLWFSVAARVVSLAVIVDLLRLWVPRRSWRTPAAMPAGTGFVASGAFLGLAAASMFVDPRYTGGGAPWAVAVVAAVLGVAGAARRVRGGGTDAPAG
ncbi:hypothetical protein [Streptomyces sp. NPDC056361]|uniref:hypothetical protein n=1 Tax=Streptomyces sp. NPDC056361 TaxID=3345795 RepID=UPI0035E007ED